MKRAQRVLILENSFETGVPPHPFSCYNAFVRSSLTRVEKVRLYPTAVQIRAFERTLSACCDLYNAGLAERRSAYGLWRLSGKPADFVWPTLRSQLDQFVELRSEWKWIGCEYSETLRDVLKRLDNSFKAFFRRNASGANAGYLRFRSKRHYDSFSYPHGMRAVSIFEKTIRLPGVGSVKYRRSGRDLPSKFGVVRIVRSCGRWFACFEHVVEAAILAAARREVGVDVGVANVAALSDGALIGNPRFADASRSAVELHQRSLARCKKGSKRRRKAILRLSLTRRREKDRRIDHAHKFSRRLVSEFDMIAFEDLRVPNMVRSAKGTLEKPGSNVVQKAGLNRAILDAAWRRAMNFTVCKAEEAGRVVRFVDPKGTSRTCPICKFVSAKNRLTQESFVCISCGHADHADVNAAINILERARSGLASAA